ncbi:MAG: hypothetical protein ACHQ1G_13480, partial [Planctomycetota bacterium]
MRRCVALLVMAASAAASQDYERLLAEARRVLSDESMPLSARFDAQYEKLAQAALAFPQRWEAYFDRGENRCNRAFFYRAEVEGFLSRARAAGMGDAELLRAREDAEAQIERWRMDAHRDFSVAEA